MTATLSMPPKAISVGHPERQFLPLDPEDGPSPYLARKCNLVLVARKRQGHTADFHRIAKLIHEEAPEIRTIVLGDRYYNRLRVDTLFRPTLTVALSQLRQFRPWRGAVCENLFLPKSAEYEILRAAGVSVPQWAVLAEDSVPDLSDFGPFVVVKPDCGFRGQEVRIWRRNRVRWEPPVNSRSHKLGRLHLVAQEFIYTGQWPTTYRVTTLFGKVLFSWKVEASRHKRPLLGPERFGEGGFGITSSGAGCRFELSNEPDVLELGRQAHAAFPDHPLLGIDIARDARTGRLYVIEMNSCGTVWHFSSRTGLGIQASNEINFDSQFGGLRRAARALIDETRRRAL